MVNLSPLFTGEKPCLEAYTDFSCSILLDKFRLLHKLLDNCPCLVSDMSRFYFEIEKLKELLLVNGYSNKFTDKCIFKFTNKLFVK